MTNFEPLKQKIWESAKADNKDEFSKYCYALMEKAVGDWWRIGWQINVEDIDDVYACLDDLAKSSHERWIEAMKCGDAPPEDISPSEGFMHIKKVIQDSVEKKRENA